MASEGDAGDYSDCFCLIGRCFELAFSTRGARRQRRLGACLSGLLLFALAFFRTSGARRERADVFCGLGAAAAGAFAFNLVAVANESKFGTPFISIF